MAPAKGARAARIDVVEAFPNLPPTLNQPLALLQAPGDDARWFVLEKTGRVRAFANAANVNAFDPDFLDLTGRVNTSSEGGLLGMAFHPDFANNGRAILSYTETGSPLVSVISRFTSPDGGQTLDPGNEQIVLRLNQDFTNHNGGGIAFGPDGYLYIGFGDGGSGGDPNSRAQDTTNLLGAFLRLDVDGAAPYQIPNDNPFAGNPPCTADPNVSGAECPEIYAWGLRNPWRWSFDRATGELWAGDVGQNAWEEIDRIERGGNYGWDCREGANPFASPAPSCAGASGLIDPVHQYAHGDGNFSVTGGFVYRGASLPALFGDYVFGDFGSGRIWRLLSDSGGAFLVEELIDTPHAIASFGEGHDGELYAVDFNGGLYRIVDAGGGAPDPPPVPALLSETGCVQPQAPDQPSGGLIPYDVNAPFWSDNADKQRWLAIPDGTTITLDTAGDFQFPSGSVLMQHFRLNGDLIETRLFMRHPDGEWAGYSYEWDAQQSDATWVPGGKVSNVGGQSWVFPSGNECLSCHTASSGFSLGLEAMQLNGDFTYPSTGRTANQLATLDEIVMFSAPLGDPLAWSALPNPSDPGSSLQDRARAYLHTNCAQCHRPGGPTPSGMDLRFTTDLADTASCDVVPQSGDLGLADARIIAPGEPGRSVLLLRMDRRDAHGMPPLASALVDTAAVALIGEWIAGLAEC